MAISEAGIFRFTMQWSGINRLSNNKYEEYARNCVWFEILVMNRTNFCVAWWKSTDGSARIMSPPSGSKRNPSKSPAVLLPASCWSHFHWTVQYSPEEGSFQNSAKCLAASKAHICPAIHYIHTQSEFWKLFFLISAGLEMSKYCDQFCHDQNNFLIYA
jgi:hypothetical protein